MLKISFLKLNSNKFLSVVVSTTLFSILWMGLYEAAHAFDISQSASAWYPGPGLTIAFLATFGPRYLICAIIGIFWYDNTFSLLDMMSGVRQVFIYGSAGLYLKFLTRSQLPLRDRSHVNIFVAIACGSTLLSAITAGLIFQPYWVNSTFIDILVSFWIGDLAGVLLACPVFLMLFAALEDRTPPSPSAGWLPQPSRSLLIGTLSIAGFAAVAFSIDAAFITNGKAWFIVLFPVAMLALRNGFGAAVVGIVVVNIVAVLLYKAFGRTGDPAQLQVLLVMTDVAALLIGAAISEHKGTAAALRKSEQRQRDIASENRMLAQAVHASSISVTIIDTATPRLALLFVNDAFCTLTGYTRDQLHDADLAGLLAPGKTPDDLYDAIRHRERARHTVDLVTADGAILRDRLSLAPIKDDDDATSAYLVLHEDIAAAQKREGMEREREKLVALGQLAGGVAHEINNLLHPMINLATEVEHLWGQEGQDARRHLRMIRSCGTKAADIVRKVLSFARQGAGPRGPLDIGDAILAAADLNRRSLPPSVAIHTRIDVTGIIQASATEVSQVLTNLLLNASHAMDGRGTINIVLDRDDAAASFRLTVTDDGAGMDEAVRARIFEPFFTTKPIGSGTGLGLSVVYGIVKDWGGTIDVRTAPNKGTTFIITVPAIGTDT
ncbi:ATP-binding protein [Azospirillum isscasi]|uniref:histidine kinase n=1 Tax=Azospirillum isscasi TaxID=3053926 RepID=A0ABU0WE02_9PROT|nr:ATP-binding protein [Azospirillum isscasi]MDQ2102406.1 ATP-binding protein [Azospirillum isscasi]